MRSDLDGRLRRAFEPPADVEQRARRAVERARDQGGPRAWLHGFAAAAALLAGGFAPLWLPVSPEAPARFADAPRLLDPLGSCTDPRVDALARELAPEPVFVCSNPEAEALPLAGCELPGVAFTSWPRILGPDGLAWSPEPGVELTGPEPWAPEPGGRLLRLSRGAERALVLVHPLADAPELTSEPTDPVRVHRRVVGGWVLHEVGVHATARFLPLFRAIE